MKSFLDGRGVGLAAGLAYSSLLSFIPLVVAVTVLTSTFFGERGTGFFRLLRFFVPGTSREVLRGVEALVDEAQVASWVATALLVLTSLRVYFDVEGAANHLWGTLRPRRASQRFALAVLVVVFGPVALGVATSFLLEAGVPLTQLHLRGLFASIFALTLIYKVVPSSQVRWGAAAAAGVLAGAGLTGLRQLFTLGFVAAAGAAKVYGTISAIAVFVTATGFAWTILLFGFSFAHAVQFRDELLAHDAPPPAAKKPGALEEAMQLLLRLTEAWHAGVSLDIPTLAQRLWPRRRRPQVPSEAPRHRGPRGGDGRERPPGASARHDHALRRGPRRRRGRAARGAHGLRARRGHPPRPLHARRRRGAGRPAGDQPRGRLSPARPASIRERRRQRPSSRSVGSGPAAGPARGRARFRAPPASPRGAELLPARGKAAAKSPRAVSAERLRLTNLPVPARFSAPTVGL